MTSIGRSGWSCRAAADSVEEVGAFARIYSVKARTIAGVRLAVSRDSPGSYLSGAGRLRSILADEQPDLIEICDKYSLFYLAALAAPGMDGGGKAPDPDRPQLRAHGR